MSTVKSHLIKSLVIAAVATAGILGGGSAFADTVAAPGGNESEETPIGVPVDDVTVEAPNGNEGDETPIVVPTDDDATPGGNESDETPIVVPTDDDATPGGNDSDPAEDTLAETGPADLVGVAAAGSLLALGGLALGTLARRKRRAA
ncbi:hypothetical protein ACFVWL_06215 [Microbacterium sp. NPDC058269]|uniref:hypothetical protein n=1 Tax=Microbacterium sp. NPDC058269 TaxID=3346414 RepID=UPI0036DDDD67